MVSRTCCFLVLALFAVAEAKVRAPAAPMDIVHGTSELIYDVYSAAYDTIEGHVTKSGVPAKVRTAIADVLTEDPIQHTCSKIGCDHKDIKQKRDQAQSTMLQAKAMAYEHGSKALDQVHDLAGHVVTQIETHVPSYKGAVRKTAGDVILVFLYSLFVLYVVLRITRFTFSTVMSIFCCVCCCGCCRGKKAGPKKGKNGVKSDAKAPPSKPTTTSAKAKAKK